jgi:hypothetical protein
MVAGTVYKVLAGIGILIAFYLFLVRPDATASIIRSFSSALSSNVKTLQGR